MGNLSDDGWISNTPVKPVANSGFSNNGFGGGFGNSHQSASPTPMSHAQPAYHNNPLSLSAQSGFGATTTQNANIASSFPSQGQTTFGSTPPSSGFSQAGSGGFENTSKIADSHSTFGALSNLASNGFGSQTQDPFGSASNGFSTFGIGSSQNNFATNAPTVNNKPSPFETANQMPQTNASSFGSSANSGFGGSSPSGGFGVNAQKEVISSAPKSFSNGFGGFSSNSSSGGNAPRATGTGSGGFGSALAGGFSSGAAANSFGGSTVGSGGFGNSTSGGGSFGGQSSGGFGGVSGGFCGSPNADGQSFGKGEGGGGCFNCGGPHKKADCTEPFKETARRPPPPDPCPLCKQTGHWKRDCPNNPDKVIQRCSNCKEVGHYWKECQQPPKCMNCGGEGHRSRECQEPKKERGPLICPNCDKEGHHAHDCQQPLKPREDGSKPPSTFVPVDEHEESLFQSGVIEGNMFDRFFDAPTTITAGGVADLRSQTVEKLEKFDQLPLGDRVHQNLKLCGYTRPTPVQQHTMPIIMQDIDVVACAQTGSGKTAAYLLPILSKLLASGDVASPLEGCCYPRALIVVPTRELAVQVYNETRKYAYGTVINCKAVYGGTAVQYQKDELKKGATIVAATLGRLKHFVEDGTISLDKLRFFVVDEVDRLLEQDQTDQIINAVYSKINNKDLVQGIMFSATFPAEVQSQATLLLKPNYKMVTVDAIGTANKCIHQDIECVDPKEKKNRLLELLDIDKKTYSINPSSKLYEQKTLIFVSKKGFADTLASIVSQSGLPATTIHSDRLQNERSEAMRDFIYGKKAVMVATAVAERGLDIRGVDHVINYDLPEDIHQYIHRIGRTGRRGNPGKATSFFTLDKDRALAGGLLHCLESAGQVVPEWLSQEAVSGGSSFNQAATPAAAEDW